MRTIIALAFLVFAGSVFSQYLPTNIPAAEPPFEGDKKHIFYIKKPKKLDKVTVSLYIWDSGAVDNDIVTVMHNKSVVIKHYSALKQKRGFQFDLEPGRHVFRFVPNNEGDISPNTARIMMRYRLRNYKIWLSRKAGIPEDLVVIVS